jgi:hypothetical protein
MRARLMLSLPWIALALAGWCVAQSTLTFWFDSTLPPWAVPAALAAAAVSYVIVFFAWPGGRRRPALAAWWEYAALAGILAIGGLWRARMPVVPLAWPDSWFYISMSFDWETYHHLWPSLREFGYQAFVVGVMCLFESPVVLVVIQHLSGLASAALLFIAVANVRCLVPGRSWVRAFGGLVAVGTAGAWALSTVSCFYEEYLMPESIYPFLSAAALALATGALRSRANPRAPKLRAGVLAASSAAVMFLMYATIPRWGFGVLLGPVILYAVTAGSPLSFRQRVAVWAAPFLAFGALILLPDALLHQSHDPKGNTFVQMHMLCIQARIIRPELDREAAQPHPRFPRELLARIGADIDREIRRYQAVGHPNGPSPSLGFDPDQLMYQDSVMADLGRAYANDPPKIRAFGSYFYEQAWLHQPGRMMGKIATEMTLVFAHPSSLFDVGGFSFVSTDDVPGSRRMMNEALAGRRAGGWEAMPALHARYAGNPATFSPPPAVVAWHQLAAVGYLPVLLVGALWAASSRWCRPSSAVREAWSAVVVAAFLGFAGNALSCLTIAIIHTLDPGRYRDTQMLFSLYAVSAGCVALAVVWDAFLTGRRRKRP